MKVYYKGQRGEGVYDVAFPGLIRNVEQRYRETGSETMKQEYESFMRITPCTTCKGQRLKKESLAVTVADKNIYEVTNMPDERLQGFLRDLKLSEQQELIGKQIRRRSVPEWDFLRKLVWSIFPLEELPELFPAGGTENPSCHTDRFRPCWSCLYSGRAKYRSPSAG